MTRRYSIHDLERAELRRNYKAFEEETLNERNHWKEPRITKKDIFSIKDNRLRQEAIRVNYHLFK